MDRRIERKTAKRVGTWKCGEHFWRASIAILKSFYTDIISGENENGNFELERIAHPLCGYIHACRCPTVGSICDHGVVYHYYVG